METQRPHPSALTYGIAAILTGAAIITATHITGWNLARAFNLGMPHTQTADNTPPSNATIVQTSYIIQAP